LHYFQAANLNIVLCIEYREEERPGCWPAAHPRVRSQQQRLDCGLRGTRHATYNIAVRTFTFQHTSHRLNSHPRQGPHPRTRSRNPPHTHSPPPFIAIRRKQCRTQHEDAIATGYQPPHTSLMASAFTSHESHGSLRSRQRFVRSRNRKPW